MLVERRVTMDLGAACVKQAPRFRLKPVLQCVRWLACGTEGDHGFGCCAREEWVAFVGEWRGTSACERAVGRAVWRRWRWAMKRPGRQTRPTYGRSGSLRVCARGNLRPGESRPVFCELWSHSTWVGYRGLGAGGAIWARRSFLPTLLVEVVCGEGVGLAFR